MSPMRLALSLSSWPPPDQSPGVTRPSMPFVASKDVEARLKAGHDARLKGPRVSVAHPS